MQENPVNNLLRSGKDCATIYMENRWKPRPCCAFLPTGVRTVFCACLMDPGGEPGNNARRKNYEKTFIGPASVPGHGHRPGTDGVCSRRRS